MRLMTKFYLFAVVSFFIFSESHGQNPTPNPGFENWTLAGNHYDPDNWNTLNPTTSPIGILSATRATGADVHTGSYAIKLTTKLVFGVTANGIATTGTIITTPPYGIVGGIPYHGRPDSIVGWFKCDPEPGDTGFAEFTLLGSVNDTIGYVRWWAPPVAVNTYTRFSKAITYFSAATPDTSQWILSSSKGTNQVVGSSIIFDDVKLITNPVGINEAEPKPQISVYPAVTAGNLSLSNETGKKIKVMIFSSSGKQVKQYEFADSLNTISLHDQPGGLYFYKVIDKKGVQIAAGKVMVL